jgi:hypothetical protein
LSKEVRPDQQGRDPDRRRPNVIQMEAARAEAREEARYAGRRSTRAPSTHQADRAGKRRFRDRAQARQEARDEFAEGQAISRSTRATSIPRKCPTSSSTSGRTSIRSWTTRSYRLRAIENYDDATGNRPQVGRCSSTKNIITRERKSRDQVGQRRPALQPEPARPLDIGDGAPGRQERSEVIEEAGRAHLPRCPAPRTPIRPATNTSPATSARSSLAKAAAERNPEFRRNVEALEAAQPMPLAPSQIHATLGMPWIRRR